MAQTVALITTQHLGRSHLVQNTDSRACILTDHSDQYLSSQVSRKTTIAAGQVFSIYCNLRKNRYRTEVCVFLRLLVPEKNLSQASHLSLKHQVPKLLPENIGE